MKLTGSSNKVLCLCLALFTLFNSCSKMNDLHDKYLKRGETIYVAKPDSVFAFAGKERVKIRYWESDPKSVKLVVYWLSRTDSMVFDIPAHAPKDSIEIIIPNLSEYNYLFELVTMNSKMENRSLSLNVNASSYGDQFRSHLLDRAMESYRWLDRNKLEIKWRGAIEKGVGCELLYDNIDGNRATRFVPMAENLTQIEDFEGELEMRTVFLPEKTAIDTFNTPFKSINIEPLSELELDKTLFKQWNPPQIPYTYYDWTSTIDKLWDNTPATQYLTFTPSGFPYSFTFDLGQTVKLKRFKHWQRIDRGVVYRIQNVKKFQLWGSATSDVTDDFSEWIKLGDFEVYKPSGLPWGQETDEDIAYATQGDNFTIDPNAPPVRYIRYVVEDSWDGAQNLFTVGELTFFQEVH